MTAKSKWGIWALGLLALVGLRFLLWWSYSKTPIPLGSLADPLVYTDLGWSWARGLGMPQKAVFHPPLYPYIVGLVFKLAGKSIQSVIWVQNVLGVATSAAILAAFVWWVGRLRYAVLSLLFLLQSGAWVAYEWRLYPESLAINVQVLALLAFWWLWRMEEPKQRLLHLGLFVCGFLTALSVLLRPNLVLALPVLGAWCLLPNTRQRWRWFGVMYLFLFPVLTLVPIMVRNHGWGAGYSLSANTGITFFQGNNSFAKGGYTVVPGVSPDILQQNDDVMRIGRSHGATTIAEANRYWMNQGIEWWKENPGSGMRLVLERLRLFLAPSEFGGDMPVGFERQRVPVLRWASLLNFTAVIFFAFLGIRLLQKARFPWVPALAFLGATLATCLVFYMNNRYRAPAWPILLIMGVFGVERCWAEWTRKAQRRKGEQPRFIYGAALLFGGIVVLYGMPISLTPNEQLVGWHNWGVMSARASLDEQAESAYKRVLEMDPSHRPTLENLGNLYLRKNELAKAEEVLNLLLLKHPQSVVGHKTLADVRKRRGDWKGVEEAAVGALRQQPGDRDASELLAEALFAQGDRARACPLIASLAKVAGREELSPTIRMYHASCQRTAFAQERKLP